MPESPAGAATTASQAIVTTLSPSPSAEIPRPARKHRVWRFANRRRYVSSFMVNTVRRYRPGSASVASLADSDMVAGRIAEGAVADAVRLVHWLLDHLRTACHQALEDGVEVGRGEVHPAQETLGEQVAEGLPIRRR